MKKFIHKTNQYLLENHPLVWNTKLLWVLALALILHGLFFVFGFLAITNPEVLHEYSAKSIFFENGTIYISIIISILTLVLWLIFLFKNNAFKSFYPTSRLQLFKQFLIYLIVIFFSTTFYISHNFGVKSYISFKYDEKSVEKEIIASNAAALFFSKNTLDYTINQRSYPAPFDTLYCETYNGITQKKDSLSLKFLDYNYRFYTLYKKDGALNQMATDSSYKGYVYFKTKDTIRTYFFKDSIFDVSSYVQTENPSYFNYSNNFYLSQKNRLEQENLQYNYTEYNDYEYEKFNYRAGYNKNNRLWNKLGYDLLKRNDPNEIKKILSDFLMICNQYKIKHNLNVDNWFDMVYHPNDNFELKNLIRNQPKEEFQFESSTPKTAIDTFYKDHITNYYLDNDALHRVFENIEDIKESNPLFKTIHFFIWFAFFFSSLVFMFRITGLRPLLFTIISIGVLTMLVILLTVLYEYITRSTGNSIEYFVSYLTLVLGSIILSIPLFYIKKIKKFIVAICLNISILGFTLYIFLIITIISLHQSAACVENYSYYNNDVCFNLLSSLGMHWSFILFTINLLFIYFYSKIIKNWKALPEG
ncbi:hypothetical protein Q4Q34_13265 [Flavivirga abyssicola]|uniref:hypothetical protein n=1 Tax=Flavivirga abyssicola TaxID=3063533 RepID=UPI0026DFBCE3|nr:hypothetical protein [Flavivirga sp. MEBiC07777]WVK12189.1 hypothetical protein Q4Q34_13265 [Flavivirga sp. MEBiC07777]